MSKILKIEKEIILPENVDATINKNRLTVKGEKGEITRTFRYPKVSVEKRNKKILVQCTFPRKKDRAMVGTIASHIRNMVKGVSQRFEYELRIVYSHFPVKTRVDGKSFIVENFLGESRPRKAYIVGNVEAEIKGEKIILRGVNLEDVGQTAANIEKCTRIKGYDSRIFQDGIYIVKKGG